MIHRPNIITNPTREMILPSPKVNLRGFFTVELIHAATGIVKERLEFANTITNSAINYAFVNQGWLRDLTDWCAVGTSSTAPAATDTALIAEVSGRTQANGGTSDTSGYTAGPPDFAWGKRVRVFGTTEGNGNLTEIGFFSASTAGTMWTRQLLKTALGVPTTIIKTSSDQLRVTYEVRVYPPLDPVIDTIDVSGTPYDYELRAISVDVPGSGWRAFVDFSLNTTHLMGSRGVHVISGETNTTPGRTGGTLPGFDIQSSMVTSAYVGGNFYRDHEATFDPSAANYATGIGELLLYNPIYNSYTSTFCITFPTTKIPKDNTKQFVMAFREEIIHNYVP